MTSRGWSDGFRARSWMLERRCPTPRVGSLHQGQKYSTFCPVIRTNWHCRGPGALRIGPRRSSDALLGANLSRHQQTFKSYHTTGAAFYTYLAHNGSAGMGASSVSNSDILTSRRISKLLSSEILPQHIPINIWDKLAHPELSFRPYQIRIFRPAGEARADLPHPESIPRPISRTNPPTQNRRCVHINSAHPRVCPREN